MTRHMRKLFSFCIVWLAACLPGASPLRALDSNRTLTQYAHRIWGQEEGLLQPTIYSILQSHDGFLWLGTQDSLIRFDGMHFREFEGAAKAGLQRTLVRSLAEDANGGLWVASLGAGVVRVGKGNVIQRYTTKEGMPADDAFCVVPDSSGGTWVCTNRGLVRIGRDGKLRVYSTADGLPSNQVRDTCVANDGTRWVAGLDFGLSFWDGARFQRSSAMPANEVSTVLECSKKGSVWVGTAHGALEIDKAKSRRLTTRDGLPDNEVLSLLDGPDGTIWIGTNNGISRYRNNEWSVYRTRDGLSHSVVLSLFIDREGSLWAGTKDGLDQFTDGKVTPYSTNEGMLSNDAGPVLEDNAGRLWVGTLGHGLSFFDGRRFHALTKKDGLLDDYILSLQVDQSGDLWVGSNGGVNRLRAGKVVGSFTQRNGLSGAQVRALSVDSQGVLWAGTNHGLNRLEGDRFRRAAVASSDAVVALNSGRNVRLFISTEAAGFSYLKDDKEFTYSLDVTRPVVSSFIDVNRREAWLGTNGSGLLHWKNGTVTRLRVKDGLFDNRIYSVLSDGGGNFWMASSKGIFRVSEQEIDEFSSGKRRYVNSIPFSTGQLRFECQSGVQPAACRTHDGRLWFSTTNGLVVLDPRRLAGNTTPPPAQITSIIVNGRRMEAVQGLRLQAGERNLELRYAGLSFISPEKVTFRYMLDEFDKTWTEAGSRREAFFTNLPPGQFRFRVTARNADGTWSTSAASLGFTVEPRLYQRAWFFPAAGLLLGALTIAFVRLRIARLKHRFDEVLAERSRIARELHDTLLQGLSGITMQLQALWTRLPASKERSLLGEIIGDAARCSAEARQSLWGLRAAGNESLPFSGKLEKLVQDAAAKSTFTPVLLIQPLSSSPEIEYQLLRIAQEAVSNVVKHAHARRLEVRLEQTAGQIALLIKDDGTGFDRGRQQFGHFGITGMLERAKEIGAKMSIDSEPGGGTTLSVRVPLAQAPATVEPSQKLERLRG
jgi:signal transduction histidine kinase/ligand-binding sensor domain-containing protein